jgi:chromosome segregation ATPase
MLSLYSDSKQQVPDDSSDEREEIESLRHQVTSLKESLKATRERHANILREERESAQETRQEVESLYVQIDLLKKKFSQQQHQQAQDLKRALADKDSTIETLTSTVEALRQKHSHDATEKDRAFQEALASRSARDEAEEHLKIAHQHLSKKVRETTDLSEKLKALQSTIEQMSTQILTKNESLAHLEHSLRVADEKEVALHRDLQSAKKMYEERQAEWQAKFSALQLELEHERAEKERMHVYEERCHQIARYWDSMGKVLWDQRSSEALMRGMLARQNQKPGQNILDLSVAPAMKIEDPIGEP